MADNMGPSGFTDAEAREFHGLYVTGFLGFTAIAVVAHIFVYVWRPWPAPSAPVKVGALIEGVQAILNVLV